MRKWLIAGKIWLVLSYMGLALLLLLLHGRMTISLGSIAPLMLAGIMLFQSILYKFRREGEQVDHHVYTRFTAAEKEKYERLFADVIVCFLPFQFALVCFLSDLAKVILSIVVYFAAILCISVFWRLLYGREVKARRKEEKEELKAQIKRENEGKYR